MNKVGPFDNPHEYYNFYTLPFCQPTEVVEKSESLGEALEGHNLMSSKYLINFGASTADNSLCPVVLNPETAAQFATAVEEQFWYQLYIDDLPVWGLVGAFEGAPAGVDPSTVEGLRPMVYTHQDFSIGRNGDQIVDVNMTFANPVVVEAGAKLSFTYSVKWVNSPIEFDQRFHKYLAYDFFEHSIHWYSIVNSFILVLLLVCLVFLILVRTLKADYDRYDRFAESEEDFLDEYDKNMDDDSGWKQIHGDVFRAPSQVRPLAIFLGSGAQLLTTAFVVVLYAIAKGMWPGRGTLLSLSFYVYALAGVAGGFVSSAYHTYVSSKTRPGVVGSVGASAKAAGSDWVQVLVGTWAFFPSLAVATNFLTNVISLGWGAAGSIPFGAVVQVALVWAVLGFPSVVIGTLMGRHWNGLPAPPCRVNPYPRIIPSKSGWLSFSSLTILGGILPFGSIFIEIHFIFKSLFSYKYYYVYGFALLVMTILIIVSACISIVACYFSLNAEDYRWQWLAFSSASSTGGYLFLYSIYFFMARTTMSGLLQTALYFSTMSMLCVALALVCGTAGFVGAFTFVNRIYKNIKIE